MISFKHVSLSLGGRTVLNDIDLEIGGHEFVGILGANGAGKTTLLRAVLGLVPVASGRIEILGQKARRGNPAIGYMPQGRSAATGMRLSGWDFVAGVVGGHRPGLPILNKVERIEVDRALELVGSTAFARRPIAETSGGERQRLMLAQALVGRPKILLLDEPLISLDPHRQQTVIDLVKAVQTELKITVLLSAHEINPLLGAITQVLYLAEGKAALGPVDEVITGPSLSRLYGSAIDVIRLEGRIFVMSGNHDLARDTHDHEGHSHENGHHSHA